MPYLARKIMLAISLLVILITSLIISLFYYQNTDSIDAFKRVTLASELNKIEADLQSSVLSLKNNTLFLSELPPVQGIVRASNADGYDEEEKTSKVQWESRLSRIFSEFLKSNPECMKIRYIAHDGKEIVSVEKFGKEVVVVGNGKLQEKSQRYYFKEAMTLKPGQVYLSKIDLNQEFGQLGKDKLPTLRAAVAIYNPEDLRVYGILVVSKNMRDTFRKNKEGLSHTHQFLLADSSGHYLVHPQESKAFAFEHYNAKGLFDEHPQLKSASKSVKFLEENNEVLFALKSIQILSQRQFYIVIKDSGSELLLKAKSSVRDIVLAAIVVLCLAIGLICFIVYFVSAPVSRLRNAVERYRRDGVMDDLPLNAEGEVGLLAHTLQSMMVEVDERAKLLKESEAKQQKAILASKSKSTFLASMSHEIRTPLSTVVGYADLLMYEDLTVDQKSMLGTIKESSVTLMALINDILDISKIEAGEIHLEQVPFNLEELLFLANEQFHPKVKDKKVELLVDVGSFENQILIGDPVRIKQVLINLIGNAVKFTSRGEVLSRIQVLNETSESISLQISVRDTGIGIAQDKLGEIFQAFKQEEVSTTREYGGTGLGLDIAQKIVCLMNSEIKVESTQGEGTTFSFDVVFQKGPSLEVKESTLAQPLDYLNILCVDSNLTALSIFEDYCCKLNINFLSATSASEALAKCESEENIDVIVNSVPLHENPNFVEDLRGVFRGRELPCLIAVMAGVVTQRTSEIKKMQYDDYLLKPLRLGTFRQVISLAYMEKDSVLKGRRAEDTICELPKSQKGDLPEVDSSVQSQVLLVEDNLMNQKVALSLLKVFGCLVDVVNNGQEALDLIEDNSYNFIFMDLQMPVMDGFETTRRLRENGCEIPIIALTANVFEADRKACKDVGMNDFMTKPIQNEVIRKMVEKYSTVV